MNKKKVLEYGALTGGIIGGFLLYEYLKSREIVVSHTTSSTSNVTTSTPTTSSSSTSSTSSSSSGSVNCSVIYSTDYNAGVLQQCFGVQLACCGFPSNLLSQNGFCEAGASGLNYMTSMPNVTGTIIFENLTDGFFGYWWVTGEFATIPHCYCQGGKLVYTGGNGAFYYYGEILPNGYSWLPYYEAFSYGFGFLTYKGIYWGSPNLTASAYQYAHQHNQNYIVKITATPDQLGYQPMSYTTPQGGSLCLYDPYFNTQFCYSLQAGQTFPFWATNGTTAYFCPPGATLSQCQQVYG